MSLPKVSIITPVYNSVKTIEKTIESVVSQTYPAIEYILVDAKSNDGTIDVIDRYSKKYPDIVKYVSEKDNGIYDAMNKGTSLATGEWVYYLGGDDSLHSKEIISQIFEESASVNCDLIYGNVAHPEGAVGNGEFNTWKLMQTNIPHQAIFYRRAKVISLGGFDSRYRIMADKLLNMRFFSEDLNKVKYKNLIVANFSHDGVSSRTIDKLFHRDMDSLAKMCFSKYYQEEEIYKGIITYSFHHIKSDKILKGMHWIYKTGNMSNYWKDIVYCLLVRVGIKREFIS